MCLLFRVDEKIEPPLSWQIDRLDEVVILIVPLVFVSRERDVVSITLHPHVRGDREEAILQLTHVYVFHETDETLLVETHHEHVRQCGQHVPRGRHVVGLPIVVDVVHQGVPLQALFEHRLEVFTIHGTHEVDAEILLVRFLSTRVDGLLCLLSIEQGFHLRDGPLEDVYDAQDSLLDVVLLTQREPWKLMLKHHENRTHVEGLVSSGPKPMDEVGVRSSEFTRTSVSMAHEMVG